MDKSLIETLKEFGINTEKELDAALKKSTFCLGVMAADSLDFVPCENVEE